MKIYITFYGAVGLNYALSLFGLQTEIICVHEKCFITKYHGLHNYVCVLWAMANMLRLINVYILLKLRHRVTFHRI